MQLLVWHWSFVLAVLVSNVNAQEAKCGLNERIVDIKADDPRNIQFSCEQMTTETGEVVKMEYREAEAVVIKQEVEFDSEEGTTTPEYEVEDGEQGGCMEGEMMTGMKTSFDRNGNEVTTMTCATTVNAELQEEDSETIEIESRPGAKVVTREGQIIKSIKLKRGPSGKLIIIAEVADVLVNDYDFGEGTADVEPDEACMCLCAPVCYLDKENPAVIVRNKRQITDMTAAETPIRAKRATNRRATRTQIRMKQRKSFKGLGRGPGRKKGRSRTVTIKKVTKLRTKKYKKTIVQYATRIEKRKGINVFVFRPNQDIDLCPEDQCSCDCVCDPNAPLDEPPKNPDDYEDIYPDPDCDEEEEDDDKSKKSGSGSKEKSKKKGRRPPKSSSESDEDQSGSKAGSKNKGKKCKGKKGKKSKEKPPQDFGRGFRRFGEAKNN